MDEVAQTVVGIGPTTRREAAPDGIDDVQAITVNVLLGFGIVNPFARSAKLHSGKVVWPHFGDGILNSIVLKSGNEKTTAGLSRVRHQFIKAFHNGPQDSCLAGAGRPLDHRNIWSIERNCYGSFLAWCGSPDLADVITKDFLENSRRKSLVRHMASSRNITTFYNEAQLWHWALPGRNTRLHRPPTVQPNLLTLKG
jgi:hypothetical protein